MTEVRFLHRVLEFVGVLEEILNMASFNRVVLLGNLTRDVELRMIGSGTAVCDLGLAVNDRFKNKSGEWVDEPTFVDVTLWGRTAEIASEYLSKGSQVLIEGRLKLETWEKDGQKRSKLKVIGEKLQLLGQKGQRPSIADSEPVGVSGDSDRGFDRDEIPF